MIFVWLIVGILVVGIIWLIAAYNGLVSERRQTMNAWAQIDVQLKRRYDLIPNLVETVKGYMKHEQDTLEKVIQARNRAVGATSVKEKAQAEMAVAGALSGIFALSEAYPELRSNENMIQLQEELRSTENKISFARQYYNDVVTSYNTKLETFPTNLIVGMGNFQPKELFELEEAAAREPVKVQF
jgi:LemA protein